MDVMMVFFFVLGCLFGSFYNVVGLRVPKGESILRPNSHCPACGKDLTWYDLIPVFSFLLLKGRCRYCGEKISPLYPVMETVTGFLFALSYHERGISFELVVAFMFVSLLVIVTVSDLAYMIIPDKILAFFLLLFLFLLILSPRTPWWDSLVGAGVGFTVLYVLAVISRGGMGGGDIKLFFCHRTCSRMEENGDDPFFCILSRRGFRGFFDAIRSI